MPTIKVNTTRDNELGQQLLSIRNLLLVINENPDAQLDLSDFKYAPPTLSVVLSALVEQSPKDAKVPSDSYLNTICFPKGLKPDAEEKWNEILESYSTKSFIPLIHFPTSKEPNITKQRNDVVTKACHMIRDIARLPTNYYGGISYMISEITDNIVDHANCERGWISFQYYRKAGFLDICIADSGRGLLKAYQEYQGSKDFSNINNHLDAIDFAIKGESTKQDAERGFGLHTSREMLIEGLNGKFVYCSGNGLMYNYDLFDFKAHYNGTFLAIRIPCKTLNRNFKLLNFVE